jgi:hypothetical protein
MEVREKWRKKDEREVRNERDRRKCGRKES